MRFLVDECWPRAVAEALRAIGHEVLYAAETLASETDIRLASLAREGNFLLVTADYDFADMVVRDGIAIPGLILIGSDIGLEAPQRRAERLIEALTKAPADLLDHITVVGVRLRQRRLRKA